jgi:hypothetical protein
MTITESPVHDSDFRPRSDGPPERSEAGTPESSSFAAATARRSVRWSGRAFGGVFVVGGAAACCGGVPLGLLFAAAGGAGVAAGLGVTLLAVASAAALAVGAASRRRGGRR